MNIKLYIAGTIVLAAIAIGLMKTSRAYDSQTTQKKGDNPNCRVTPGGAMECDNDSKKGDNPNCRVTPGGAMECDDDSKKDDNQNCRVTPGGAIECDKKVKGKNKK